VCKALAGQELAQARPGASRGITVANGGNPERPADRQLRVVVAHGEVLCGIVRTVDPVADVRHVAQRLEAVKQTWGNIQVPELFVVQPEGLVLAKRGRVESRIDQHVMDGATGAADKLGLAPSVPKMHAADDSLTGPRLRVLHEGRRVQAVRGGDLSVEGSGEETAAVVMRRRHENQDAIERRATHLHRAIVAELYKRGG
jgi:hypothetical protein